MQNSKGLANNSLGNQSNLTSQNVREKLESLQKTYYDINEQITLNLKTYDEIVSEDKEAYQKIRRNLEDIKTIFINDLDKFEQTVDQSIQYNEALYNRLEKDVYYLRDDQELLRRKMLMMQKRVCDMEEQIGEFHF